MSDDQIPEDQIPQVEPEYEEEGKVKRKKKLGWFISLFVVGIIILCGFVLLYYVVKELKKPPKKPGDKAATEQTDKKDGEKDKAKKPEEKPKVKVYKVSKENFIHVMETLGTIQAKSKVDLRFEVNGLVDVMNVKEGDLVRQDDTIGELTHADSELKVDFRKSKLKEAQIELKNLQAKVAQNKELLDAGAITQSKYDEAKFAEERAEQAVKSAKIELKSAEAELEKTYLKTAIEGIVGQVKVQKGEFVTSQTLVLSVMEVAEVNAEFSVLEKDILNVKEGLEILLSVDTYPGEKFKGSIISLGTIVETTEGRARKVKALIPNPDRKLLPGLFAHVEIVLFHREDALTVPVSAFPDVSQDASSIWVVGEGDKVAKREIQVEHLSPDKALIESGIKVGELVVVETAALKIQDGQQVEIVEVREAEGKEKEGKKQP